MLPTPSRLRGRWRLLATVTLALAAAQLGGAPARAATTVATAQAEQGTLDGWYMQTVADPAAAGGKAVRFDWPGTVRTTVKLPADADAVTLRVRGDQCAGAPAYTVTVDGVKVATGSVTGTSWTDQTQRVALIAGTHVLAVRYDNDHTEGYGASACNRNLYLDQVGFAATGAGAVPANPPIPDGFVRQSGTRLLDGAGRPLRLRGVNVGGWLLWEGWIWGQGMDYVGESAMMRNLSSLVGAGPAEDFRSQVRNTFATAEDFRAMAADGLNVARVGFSYRMLEDDAAPYGYRQAGWDVLDRTLRAAEASGVYVVLSMQVAPCSQTYGFISDYVGGGLLWGSAACQDRMAALWKAIAARYAGEHVIAGYDVMNETMVGDQQLLALYKRMTAAIRSVDRNHTLIYEGNTLARTFDLFSAPLDANQMLSFHDYPWMIPGQDLAARMPAYDAAATRLGSPLWAGEFGQSTYADVRRYVDTFDADPLVAGWAQYTFKQAPGFPALQTIQHTAASKKLISWIDDPSRPRPTAAEAQQGMTDFLAAIRFENTVPDAVMRDALACRTRCDAASASASAAPGAPAAAPLTSTTSTVAAAGTRALGVSVRRVRLASALRRGLKVAVTAPSAGRLVVTAQRGGRVVARGRLSVTRPGRRTVGARFTPVARRALRGRPGVTLRVAAVYVPAAGTPATQRCVVRLKHDLP